MNDTQKSKILRFIGDPVMSGAVYDVLLKALLKERNHQDVHILAASRLAIDFLNDGWKDLEKFREVEPDNKEKTKYV